MKAGSLKFKRFVLITTLSRRLELSWSQGEISQRTLAGQIYLTLNEEKITQAFKKFWLDGKVIKEMDYPIFMAVNQKPVKDNSGEYRYKKDERGDYILDKNGHPIIDHDLDQIAEAFIKFAKEEGFYF